MKNIETNKPHILCNKICKELVNGKAGTQNLVCNVENVPAILNDDKTDIFNAKHNCQRSTHIAASCSKYNLFSIFTITSRSANYYVPYCTYVICTSGK